MSENFASAVAQNKSGQLRDATLVTLERSDPTSALLIFDEPIETRAPMGYESIPIGANLNKA